MPIYTWTLEHRLGEENGQGSLHDLKAAMQAAHLPGVASVDWIVDLAIADGFVNGEAVHHHDMAAPHGWKLTILESSEL
jgi:hypothetical protein